MWEFLLRQLIAKSVGRRIAGKFFNDEVNGPEVYADRIKRDFHLHDYADAWGLYSSDPGYWERYYDAAAGGPNWNNMFVRDSANAANVPSRNNVFEYGFPESSAAPPSTAEVSPTHRSAAQSMPLTGSMAAGLRAAIATGADAGTNLLSQRWSGPSTGLGGTNRNQPPSASALSEPSVSPFPGFNGNRSETNIGQLPSLVFATGAPPIAYSSASQSGVGGLPGLIAQAAGMNPSNSGEPMPQAGGLLALIQEYMGNSQSDAVR